MEEIIKALEAALKKLVREEFKASLEAFMDKDPDYFDTIVNECLENNTRVNQIIEEKISEDLKDMVKDVVKGLDFEIKVY